MSPEAQRIAIAEACGWREFHHDPEFDTLQGIPAHNQHIHTNHGWGMGSRSVPDYLDDLNAMHEAESTLSDKEQMADYFIRISESRASEHGLEGFDAIHATAAQRAEAFLRTLGKWE